MFAVDLHAHTRFFHGLGPGPTAFDALGARMLGWFARRRSIDGVALTNHDYSWRPAGARARSGGDDSAAATDPIPIPGIEVSTTHGHLLVIGPDPPRATEPGRRSPGDVVERAHDRNCAAVLAHPFRDSTIRETDVPVDAVEVNGKHPHHRERVVEFASARDLPVVGGSDAHYPFEVGRAFTRVDVDHLSPASVVDAVRAGRVEPVLRRYPIDRLLTPLYRRIHGLRGHTE